MILFPAAVENGVFTNKTGCPSNLHRKTLFSIGDLEQQTKAGWTSCCDKYVARSDTIFENRARENAKNGPLNGYRWQALMLSRHREQSVCCLSGRRKSVTILDNGDPKSSKKLKTKSYSGLYDTGPNFLTQNVIQ